MIISSNPGGYSIGTEANLIFQLSQNCFLVSSTEPEPVSFTKLACGLLHLVDDGGVVVGDVEGDGAGGEEDEGLEQSLCLQEQPAPLLLEGFF